MSLRVIKAFCSLIWFKWIHSQLEENEPKVKLSSIVSLAHTVRNSYSQPKFSSKLCQRGCLFNCFTASLNRQQRKNLLLNWVLNFDYSDPRVAPKQRKQNLIHWPSLVTSLIYWRKLCEKMNKMWHKFTVWAVNLQCWFLNPFRRRP